MGGLYYSKVMRELAELAAAVRDIEARREARRKAARFRPDGKLKPAASPNRKIAESALVREPIPGGQGAEFWITYAACRNEWLRLREDRGLAHLELTLKLCDPDALNGYVAFPKRSAPRLPANDIGNIVQYIPVHGGITWARKDSFMAAWGFHTMHSGSENQPRTDRDWIRAHCWLLYRGLMLAEKLWPEFERAPKWRRAELADELLGLVEEQPLSEKLGFTAKLGILTGEVG